MQICEVLMQVIDTVFKLTSFFGGVCCHSAIRKGQSFIPTELIKKLYYSSATHSMTQIRLSHTMNCPMEKNISTVVMEAEGIALHFVFRR